MVSLGLVNRFFSGYFEFEHSLNNGNILMAGTLKGIPGVSSPHQSQS
jgi:hypothetical protein